MNWYRVYYDVLKPKFGKNCYGDIEGESFDDAVARHRDRALSQGFDVKARRIDLVAENFDKPIRLEDLPRKPIEMCVGYKIMCPEWTLSGPLEVVMIEGNQAVTRRSKTGVLDVWFYRFDNGKLTLTLASATHVRWSECVIESN